MKRRDVLFLVLALAFFTAMVIRADDTKTTDTKTPPAPVRAVAVTTAVADIYNEAAKRTADARKTVESSTVWKDYLIAQNQEQSAIFYALAEAGLKPSDGCTPKFDKDGKLQSFECPIAKAKEPEKKP